MQAVSGGQTFNERPLVMSWYRPQSVVPPRVRRTSVTKPKSVEVEVAVKEDPVPSEPVAEEAAAVGTVDVPEQPSIEQEIEDMLGPDDDDDDDSILREPEEPEVGVLHGC